MQNTLDHAGWRRHLRLSDLSNGITNAVFNGGICWLLMRQKTILNLWALDDGFGLDLLATGLLLAVILTLILAPIQRRALAATPLENGVLPAPSRIMMWLRGVTGNYRRFVVLGAALGVLCAISTLVLLQLASITVMTPAQYSLFKAIWTGLFAAALARIIINLVAAQS